MINEPIGNEIMVAVRNIQARIRHIIEFGCSGIRFPLKVTVNPRTAVAVLRITASKL
ncbi:hypothetical protein MAALD49_38560 [Marinobacter shengliensis]|nr:hypothetical protein MAALD49_38560 [Marinobacter shengliensis]